MVGGASAAESGIGGYEDRRVAAAFCATIKNAGRA